MKRASAAAVLVTALVPAFAVTPDVILSGYEAEARKSDPAFSGFSAERGRQFYASRHGADWSCASCHGATPTAPGRHAGTGKAIAPFAPAVNAERFTDPARVEKWFRRNCRDVVARECTSSEKGDVLKFVLGAGR